VSAASGNPRGVLWRIWKPGLASGLLTIIVGGLVLALPQASILVAATLFGVFLLGTGLAQLFFAFTLPKSASGRALLFINDALSLALATLSFRLRRRLRRSGVVDLDLSGVHIPGSSRDSDRDQLSRTARTRMVHLRWPY